MTRKSKNIRTEQSGFLRYRKGEMTGSERNAFERDLQKDPFAEEAGEGFERLSPGEMQDDLSLLTKKIKTRTTRKKNYVFYRIAASVAVLMIISSVFIVVNRKSSNAPPPLTEKEQVPFSITSSEPVKPARESDQAQPQKKRERSQKQTIVDGDKQSSGKTAESAAINTGKEEAPPQAPEQKITEEPERAERRAMADEAFARMPAGGAAERSLKKSEAAPAITGQVVSADDSMKQLQEAEKESASYKPPQPVTGNNAFYKYLEANLRRPDSAIAGQSSVVVVRFPVLSDGTLGNIKILRSPGEEFSKEAIRVIKAGPAWNPSFREGVAVEDSVTLRVVFR